MTRLLPLLMKLRSARTATRDWATRRFRRHEARSLFERASGFQSLKVVVSKCAIKLSLPETAPLETYDRTCTDTGHSCRVFQLILFQDGPLSGRA